MGGQPATSARFYVPPHIFSRVNPTHTIAREEIFGPVLSIMHAPSFEAALEIANSSVYKLTGGVFSRKPSHLELARRKFRVGNLYLNEGSPGRWWGASRSAGSGCRGWDRRPGGRIFFCSSWSRGRCARTRCGVGLRRNSKVRAIVVHDLDG